MEILILIGVGWLVYIFFLKNSNQGSSSQNLNEIAKTSYSVGRQFDMLADVPNIQCPTLVLGGQLDPMLPIECQRDIANALDPKLLNYREFEDCGHGVIPDVPELAIPLLRDFIKNQHKPIAPI